IGIGTYEENAQNRIRLDWQVDATARRAVPVSAYSCRRRISPQVKRCDRLVRISRDQCVLSAGVDLRRCMAGETEISVVRLGPEDGKHWKSADRTRAMERVAAVTLPISSLVLLIA